MDRAKLAQLEAELARTRFLEAAARVQGSGSPLKGRAGSAVIGALLAGFIAGAAPRTVQTALELALSWTRRNATGPPDGRAPPPDANARSVRSG